MIYRNVELYNVEELVEPEDGSGKILTRIPNRLRMTLNPNARERALHAAGCEIRFNLEDKSTEITLACEAPAILEVFQGSFQVSWHQIYTRPTNISISLPRNIVLLDELSKERRLPFDAYLTRVILPYCPAVRLVSVEGRTTPPRRDQTPKYRYLAYGSSITQGASAIRATGSYAARTAQILGVDLINLGFGSGAHCEKQIADYISQREDWNSATLEMGINMIRLFSTEEFRRRAEYMIGRIAKTHPDEYIFCIDPFTCRHDFLPPSSKLNEFRRIVRNTTEKLAMPKLFYINGRTILREPSGLSSDLTHPSPAGMEEIAANLSRFIKGKASGLF